MTSLTPEITARYDAQLFELDRFIDSLHVQVNATKDPVIKERWLAARQTRRDLLQDMLMEILESQRLAPIASDMRQLSPASSLPH
jgi:hypothetical protein